jgi:hypothetical protein
MILPGGSRLSWLWALLISLSVLRGSSPLWLPPWSSLHPSLCRLMPGLPACGRCLWRRQSLGEQGDACKTPSLSYCRG